MSDLWPTEGENVWKEMTAGSRRGVEAREGVTPPYVTVRGHQRHRASLPGGDPVFQSFCCGSSYCEEGSKKKLSWRHSS